MSSFDSSSSFHEEELYFKDVPKEFMDPDSFIKDYRENWQKALMLKKEELKSVLLDAAPRFHAIEGQIKRVYDEVESLKAQKNVLNMNVMKTQQAIAELEHKKKNLPKDNYEVISEEELAEMLQKVVRIEKESEMQMSELQNTAKTLVGQMCFYKEYLNVYVDVPQDEYYIFYFERCSGKDAKRPDEFIKIRTDNFKEYYYVDDSLPRNSKDKEELRKRYNAGISLRELVVLTRKYCLGRSKD